MGGLMTRFALGADQVLAAKQHVCYESKFSHLECAVTTLWIQYQSLNLLCDYAMNARSVTQSAL